MRTPPSVFALVALVGWSVTLATCSLMGCGGGPLAEGEAEFKRGQYPQAKQTLAGLENESRSWEGASRAEYALYRGLTFVALGDRGRAAAWLREARALEDEHPGSLRYEDARRLAVAVDANAFP